MPAARGVKRSASKSSASTAPPAPKTKKKRGAIQLEIPQALKKRGFVLACGQGDVGQLGLGEDVIETAKFKQVTALGDKIVSVSAGGMHSIAIDSTGNVWTYGCNDEGALGRPTSSDKDESTPKKVTLPGKAVLVTAGDSHSAALLDNGDVYAWGSFRDSHGSMGLVVRGREGKACREPVRVPLPEQAVGIASGGDHLVALTTSGSVYTMGCGEQGQLGRLSQRSASRDARQGFSALLVPSKVTLKGGASRIWAGYHATFVLDSNEEKLFAFGLNNYGQLGISGEKRRTAIYAPTHCDLFPAESWRAVSCGQHHSLALTGNGQVMAIGRCEYGRLGLGEGSGDAETLTPVPALSTKQCVSIAAGTSNSFAVTDTGEVYAWGMGSEGQLGTGDTSDAASPVLCAVTFTRAGRAGQVAAGGQHTLLRAEDTNPQKEPSPDPQSETEEEKVEEEKKSKGEDKPRKRQKKDQEGEVTSTSDAQDSDMADEVKPQKVNGDDTKEEMEVDEIDNTQEKKGETQDTEQKMDIEVKETKTETLSQVTTDSEEKSQEDSQDSTKSQESHKSQESDKSQDSEKSQESDKSQDSEKSQESDKSQDSQKIQESDKSPEFQKSHESEKSQDSQDVEMKTEINGTEEKIEAKTVDVIPKTNQLTTTA